MMLESMAIASDSVLPHGLIIRKKPSICFKNYVSATPILPKGCQKPNSKFCKLSTKAQAAELEVNIDQEKKTLQDLSLLGFDVVSEGELREKGFLGMRKTKMVCTIGPACSSMQDLEKLAMGGMNVARLNMCHNTRDWHLDVIRKIKWLNHEKGFCVSVMIDTEGCQIHVVDHGEPTSVKVEEDSIWLFTAKKIEGSRSFTVQANYAGFSEGIEVGDEVVIDGGMAGFEVIEKVGNDLRCKCTDPGLFLPRAKLSFWRNGKLVERNYDLPTLSKKDWDAVEFGIAEGVDFIAMSFVCDADSVRHLKKYLSANSSKSIKVLAKIENLESLQKLEEIVEASDGIMVARGDLGVDIPLEQIPTVQEIITHVCRQLNKPVIVASQLLESMVEYPTPTRAEVADVSEAVRQYADALMLSGESAIGMYGQKAISVLRMTSSRMELWSREENRQSALHDQRQLGVALQDRIAEQICNCAADMANNLGVDAIFVYTKHGYMASLLSRNRPNPPIFAFTNDDSTRMALNLQWGVIPLLVDLSDDMEANIAKTIDLIKSKGMMNYGDAVLVVSDLTPAHVTSTAFQSIQILKPSLLSPVSISQSNFPGKSDSGKVLLRARCFVRRKFKVCCGVQEGDKQSNGEEPPESLFMKELKRRGMTPTSLLEDSSRKDYGLDDETKLKEEDRGFSRRNALSTEIDKSLANQRERSMALNSEGLEGLIPRAKLLVTLGGTFFLGFWPLILVTVGFFSALYFYFGPSFVHDGSDTSVSPPQYVDPYALLEDERISQTAPRVN